MLQCLPYIDRSLVVVKNIFKDFVVFLKYLPNASWPLRIFFIIRSLTKILNDSRTFFQGPHDQKWSKFRIINISCPKISEFFKKKKIGSSIKILL